jgi:uncharacterized membrane protein
MNEFFKKNGFYIVFFLGVIVATAPSIVNKMDKDRVAKQIAQNHIKMVMTVGRNCNDCHLGASFVNLFNHKAVKGNDNVITLMMDNSKIKRW